MKYDKIDTNLFIKNRKNFINKLEQNSVAFFNSNDIYPVLDCIIIFQNFNLLTLNQFMKFMNLLVYSYKIL